MQVFVVNAQLNMSLIGQLPYSGHGDLSDIWGYVDTTGKEYALVGLQDGTSIVDISTPSSPVEVFYSSGANTIWRDLKVWNKHAYIVNEGGNGLKIIDMSNLPGAITPSDVYQFTGSAYPFQTAHDLYIDENGYCYIMGANYLTGGAIILDLNVDPQNPVEVGLYDDYYIHDGMARGDTLWAGCVNDGFFAVIDVSNKANPITMATNNTPSFTSHNCWPSDDNQTLFTTDEVGNGFIASYDVSNLSNISELDRVQSSPGQNVIPHNTFFMNDYLITSYYRDGVTIHDVSNPSLMIEVGNYDTSPQFSGFDFNGCWGVYPYLPSGLIIASDMENGLYVLGANYTRACFLEGKVTDSLTTNPIDNVQIDIVSTSTSTNTNIIGDYQTGIATAGNYDVTFSKFGYKTKTITNVSLTNGVTNLLNVELVPSVTFTLQGQVIESVTSNPIANANVRISNSSFNATVQTDGAGNFSISGVEETMYDIQIAKWGHQPLCLTNQNLQSSGNPYVYQLNDGYYDDFVFDLGWSVSGNPSTGDWERGEPVGTTNGGNDSNPDDDSQNDCLDQAYVTGNGGGNAGDDDIDGGVTVLTSPVFDLSTYTDPYIHFERWFYNGGGFGSPNDSLVITLSNGTISSVVDFAIESDADLSSWAAKQVQVSSIMTPTNNMTLTVRAMDLAPGHLAEAGIDNFFVIDSAVTTAVNEQEIYNNVVIYPNPFDNELTVRLNNSYDNVIVEVYEMTGKLIQTRTVTNSNTVRLNTDYQSGIYFVKVIANDKQIMTKKIVKL